MAFIMNANLTRSDPMELSLNEGAAHNLLRDEKLISDIRDEFSETAQAAWPGKIAEQLVFKAIDISKLFVDDTNEYQAVLRPVQVRHIVTNFLKAAQNPVLVS